MFHMKQDLKFTYALQALTEDVLGTHLILNPPPVEVIAAVPKSHLCCLFHRWRIPMESNREHGFEVSP